MSTSVAFPLSLSPFAPGKRPEGLLLLIYYQIPSIGRAGALYQNAGN
jgi:hypothetical protein